MAATDDDAREEVLFPVPVAPTEGRFTPTPYSFEFTGEDRLRLSITSPIGFTRVAVHFRMHRPGASTHASRYVLSGSAVDYATATTEFDIGEGYLLNVVVGVAEGTNYNGLQYVRLQVIRGRGTAATVLGTVVQGYIQFGQDLAWPGAPLALSTEGNGAIRTFQGPDPAAGANFSTSVPVGARWELLSFGAGFAASGAAGTREIRLSHATLGITLWQSPQAETLAPGATSNFFWAQGLALETTLNTQRSVAGLPIGYIMTSAAVISTGVAGLDAGDQWANVIYRVREWLEVT